MGQLAPALISMGRGRLLATLVLLALSLLLIFAENTPLLSVRQLQFDLYQQHLPRARPDEPVIVVSIDNQGIERYGRWPWSRQIMADLLGRISTGQPLAIGFDLVFPENDHYSQAELTRHLPGVAPALLKQIADPDQQLAEALMSEPTVLAAIAVSNALPGTRIPARDHLPGSTFTTLPAAVSRYPTAILSLPAFEAQAAGSGLINASPDRLQGTVERGVLRSLPAIALVNEQALLSLPLEMLRVALLFKNGPPAPAISVEQDGAGLKQIRIGDYQLPIQANGEILLHYGAASSHYYLSAVDVLDGRISPSLFKEKFVLIGSNTGFQDRIVTPRGENLPGVDAHAQVIESLLQNTALQRPFWMPRVEWIVFLLGGVLLLASIPRQQARFALLSYGALLAVLIGSGYLAFFFGGWLFDGLSIAVLLAPVFATLLSSSLIQADRDLRLSREAAARMNGELDAARRIQLGLLPRPEIIFAAEKRFSLSALLEPAQAVGGDYYDCFMLDAQRLCIAIGDVSGKGVPASLFMAISKTLTGALTRRQNNLGQAICDVEMELNRENPEFLFVTAFVGILDCHSGTLDFVCAGHDAPVLLRQGETSRLDLGSETGPPLCALGDFPYTSGQRQLQPADTLCLFTDGVTEASNGQQLFGSAALLECLAAQASSACTEDIVQAVQQAVRKFESGHPASDDLTLLVLRWNGPLL